MLDLKKVRDQAMRQGMKLMSSPQVMQVMSNPKFQQAMMRAFMLRGQVQAAWDGHAKKFAKRFKLATKDDLDQLRSTIRTLESNLKAMQARADANGQAAAKDRAGTHA